MPNAMNLSPTPKQPLSKAQKGGAAVATIAAALAIAAPFVTKWEGVRNDPYRDIVGVWTVCAGETRVTMRRYTNAECSAMLTAGLGDYAKPVLQRNPELTGHPNQLAAAVSLSYNIGAANYARSTVAKRFSAGRWTEACDAFLAWSFAGGRQVQGLLNRRRDERLICLRGLA